MRGIGTPARFIQSGETFSRPPLVSKPAFTRRPSRTTPPVIRSTAEFARFVGLARTTVSRVLNDQPGLRPATIARVRRAIEETGFTPNAYALHLKGKRTATIGVCMENLLTPPAVLKLASLQRRLRERGYASLIEVLEPGSSRRVIQHFLSLRVDAIIFVGHFIGEEIEARIREMAVHATPHLVMDQLGITGANTVTLDRVRGMSDVVEHLFALGHRTFGLVGISGTARSVSDRLAGIRSALAAHSLDFDRVTHSLDLRHVRKNDFEYGRALAASFVGEPNRPSAYLALNDEIAIGALHGFQKAGLLVPAEVSVTGFNNQAICLMPTPMLTSVDQRVDETVASAIELLLEQIDRPFARPRVRMIEPMLVVRGSSGPAPRS
jgi:DNA-binding LacI/PurR family transcriptional regulator